jgi:hypothetical protein
LLPRKKQFNIDRVTVAGAKQHMTLVVRCEQKLDRGDTILRVDGIEASNANVSALLVGNDIPGTTTIVTVQKVPACFSLSFHVSHVDECTQ